jgi:hypothetical protein
MSFKVFKKPCNECLLSSEKIVSNKRRKEILSKIKRDQSFFVCHKSDDVCCRNFYDKLGHQSQLIRIAQRLGEVEEYPQFKISNHEK